MSTILLPTNHCLTPLSLQSIIRLSSHSPSHWRLNIKQCNTSGSCTVCPCISRITHHSKDICSWITIKTHCYCRMAKIYLIFCGSLAYAHFENWVPWHLIKLSHSLREKYQDHPMIPNFCKWGKFSFVTVYQVQYPNLLWKRVKDQKLYLVFDWRLGHLSLMHVTYYYTKQFRGAPFY